MAKMFELYTDQRLLRYFAKDGEDGITNAKSGRSVDRHQHDEEGSRDQARRWTCLLADEGLLPVYVCVIHETAYEAHREARLRFEMPGRAPLIESPGRSYPEKPRRRRLFSGTAG